MTALRSWADPTTAASLAAGNLLLLGLLWDTFPPVRRYRRWKALLQRQAELTTSPTPNRPVSARSVGAS